MLSSCIRADFSWDQIFPTFLYFLYWRYSPTYRDSNKHDCSVVTVMSALAHLLQTLHLTHFFQCFSPQTCTPFLQLITFWMCSKMCCFYDGAARCAITQESSTLSRGDLFAFSSLDCRHLDKENPLKGDTALRVTGWIFSASQTALPISWLAGIQLQLEHT